MTTQAERIALVERLRAEGVLPRYQVRLPHRFTTMADRKALAGWDRETFGRRSFHGHAMRTRPLVAWRLFETLRRRRPAIGRGVPRLYWRARAAFLGHDDDPIAPRNTSGQA